MEGTTEQQMTYWITREIKELHEIREKATEFIALAQDRPKKNYNKSHKETAKIGIEDKVLLYQNIVEASWSAKLSRNGKDRTTSPA